MPRLPKLKPAQWEKARRLWESDPRPGFTWLVQELKLPVTSPAVRQHAAKASPPWEKQTGEKEAVSTPVNAPGKPEKLSRKNQTESSSRADLGEDSEAEERAGKFLNKSRTFSSKTDIAPASPETEKEFKEPACMEDLEPNEAIFVREYCRDRNAAAAAARAGYSTKSAHTLGPRVLSRPAVQAAVSEYMFALMGRSRLEAQDIVSYWSSIIKADPGDIVQHRRNCCRHCWGSNHAYQYKPAEFHKAMIDHEHKRALILDKGGADIGEFQSVEGDWFDGLLEPNAECPECFGDGVASVFVADTRKLGPEARALLAGVKETREGIEVKLHDKPKITEFMGRHLNIFNDTPDGGAASVVVTELAMRYVDLMEKSRLMQLRALEDRGLTIEAEDVED